MNDNNLFDGLVEKAAGLSDKRRVFAVSITALILSITMTALLVCGAFYRIELKTGENVRVMDLLSKKGR